MSGKVETTSHVEALKSSAIVGGSSAIVLLIRMIRIKVMAVLLGPVGVGLEAIFDSVTNLTRTAVDLGISSSGVRQIAVATGTGDGTTVAKTVISLRRICMFLGTVGAIALYLARDFVGRLAFGNESHGASIGVLSVVLFFGCVTGGQMALLQGMRRIADLARVNILGALAGTILSIPLVFLWGQDGIAIYLAVAAGAGLAVSWLFARRVEIAPMSVSLRDTAEEARGLLRLGVAFASSALMTVGALFLLRVMVARQEGVDGAGQFQAASALSMVYIGFVLQAMGTDFYPRLAAVAEDHPRCNQLVNEQAEISFLLGLPGILMTIGLAPWVLTLFYSSKFAAASEVLCWLAAGMLLRIGSWPMGFILMAKGRSAAFFWTELAAHSVYLLLAWVGLQTYHLAGAGMAFVGLYLFHWVMIYTVVRKMTGFVWSPMNRRLMAVGIAALVVTLIARLQLGEPWATTIGCFIALIAGCFSLKILAGFVGAERFERHLAKFGLASWSRKAFVGQAGAARVIAE